jgi:DNA-binding NarL/FixJ family response regulator
MSNIRIVIADDHPLFRRGLIEAIRQERHFIVVGEAETAADAWQLIETLAPDVAVLDIEMGGEQSVWLAARVRERGLDVRVLFLTMHKEESIFNEAIDAGATGYVLKDAAAMEIAAAIRAAAAGDSYVSPSISSFLLRRARRASALREERPALAQLTPSERKILRLIAQGKTSKEVAEELAISYRTVENHRANICAKLSLSGTNALLRFALENRASL